MVIGCAGEVTSKAVAVLVAISNFHMVPFKSPAYTVSILPSLLRSISLGVDRPLGLAAVPDVPALMAEINAPVLALMMYRYAWKSLLLLPPYEAPSL